MRATLVILTALVGLLVIAPAPGLAGNGDCAQPETGGNGPAATDCLRILGVAVGLSTCAPHAACVCAPKGTLPTTASDALICLSVAVGGPAELVSEWARTAMSRNAGSGMTCGRFLFSGLWQSKNMLRECQIGYAWTSRGDLLRQRELIWEMSVQTSPPVAAPTRN